MDCDVELPEPDTCGLSIFNGAQLQLQPGQALAVQYRNLNSSTAQLSRLVISAERISFSLLGADTPGPHRLLVVSGLCRDEAALMTCLHEAFHGVPQYRACQRCFGINMISELAGGGEWVDGGTSFAPLLGETSTVGDTSYFRSQLLSGGGGGEGAASVLYFLASVSSSVVQLSYARAARVLYLPSARVTYLPTGNRSFNGIRAMHGDGPNPTAAIPSSNSSSPPDGNSTPGSSSITRSGDRTSSSSSNGDVGGDSKLNDPTRNQSDTYGGLQPLDRPYNQPLDISKDVRQSDSNRTDSGRNITSDGIATYTPLSPAGHSDPASPPYRTSGAAAATRGLLLVRGLLLATAITAGWLALAP